MFDDGPADALESIVFGPTASAYRRFVRLVIALTVVLAVANALVISEIVPAGAGLAEALYLAGVGVFAVFVVSGLVQLVVLARAYERGTQEVAQSAAQLETAAAAVADTAEEVESAASEVETAANEVESAVETADSAEAAEDDATERVTDAKAKTAEAKEATESAKDVASDVERSAEDAKSSLPTDEEADQ